MLLLQVLPTVTALIGGAGLVDVIYVVFSNKHINPRDHGNLAFHTEMFKFAHSFIFKSSIRRPSLNV